MDDDKAPSVLYIAGPGRCGSTLLARVLGEIPGYVNVGELIQLPRTVAAENLLCGCRQAFADCPFWTAVGKRVLDGWGSEHLKSVDRLQRRVARQPYLPRLPAIERAARADLAAFGACYKSLYRAIAAESGAACVVDKSLDERQALGLARAGIDVRVIHLIRDVRAVAYSMSKRHMASKDPADRTEFRWRMSPARAAAQWVGALYNEKELLSRRGIPVVRMHYEDFVCQPREAVEEALAQLGLAVGPAALAHIRDRRVVLPLSHWLAGNPIKFRQGELILQADEAWRDRISRHDRIIVTMIALPYLRRSYAWRPSAHIQDGN